MTEKKKKKKKQSKQLVLLAPLHLERRSAPLHLRPLLLRERRARGKRGAPKMKKNCEKAKKKQKVTREKKEAKITSSAAEASTLPPPQP